jgi:hypothetical protein
MGSEQPRYSGTTTGKGESERSPASTRPKTSAAIPQELDGLYVLIRGAPYANALGEAKKAYQSQEYSQAMRLVKETGALYRRTHVRVLNEDPESAGLGKEESLKLTAKQAKIKDVQERLDQLVHRLEKLAKLQPEKNQSPVFTRPQPVVKPSPDHSLAETVPEDIQNAEKVGEPSVAGLQTGTIEMGSFTHLQTAAQQTALVPNADAIGFVRDHEFREGKYQAAFDRIEGLFIHLRTAAEQRAQKLRQEDLNFRSGALKMSPKDWMIKQQRDAAQTQKIDRTLRYFARVLDGLRLLIASRSETHPQN